MARRRLELREAKAVLHRRSPFCGRQSAEALTVGRSFHYGRWQRGVTRRQSSAATISATGPVALQFGEDRRARRSRPTDDVGGDDASALGNPDWRIGAGRGYMGSGKQRISTVIDRRYNETGEVCLTRLSEYDIVYGSSLILVRGRGNAKMRVSAKRTQVWHALVLALEWVVQYDA